MPTIDFLFLIRLSAIWGLLLLFYFFFLKKSNNWPVQRYFILTIYLLGLVLPFLPTVYEHTAEPSYNFSEQIGRSTFVLQSKEATLVAQTTSFWTWQKILLIGYVTACLILALRVLHSFLQLGYWRLNGKVSKFQDCRVIEHPQIKTPMAGFRTIFMPTNMGDKQEAAMAHFHEKLHVQRGHLWERLPLLIGHVFLWFHPLQWLFQYLQEQIQEYEVDEGVLQRFSLPQYGKLLIQTSMAPTMTWHPNLFSSPLKNRINMMSKAKNKQSWRFYHTIALSLLLGFIVVSCTDLVEGNTLENKVIYSAEEIDQPAHVKDQEFNPEEPNQNIFMAFGKNLKYPLAARVNGVEGILAFAYTISPSGAVQDIEFWSRTQENALGEATRLEEIVIAGYAEITAPNSEKKSLSPAEKDARMKVLNEEVQQTLMELDWAPALKDGQPVATRYMLPIRFRLQ